MQIKRPKVQLYRHTENPREPILAAIRMCRNAGVINIDPSEYTKESVLIQSVIKSGHTSVLEHASFTFIVTGMSLPARTQFFRHRLMSPTEQSKRAIEATELGVVIPDSILGDDAALEIYLDAINTCYAAYDKLRRLGIEKEDARYCMPQSLETSFIVTINGRELFESIFPDRLCRRAQWEVRYMVGQMYRIAMGILPDVYKLTGPRCQTTGCRESEKCAKEVGVIVK